MKSMILLFLCVALILSGCAQAELHSEPLPTQTSEETVMQTESIPEDTAYPQPEVPDTDITDELLAVSVPAYTETTLSDDGTELFFYTAQHMQLIFPDEDVANSVILDFLNRVDASRADAKAVMHAAQSEYSPEKEWYPYYYQLLYSPTRIDRGVLSLYGVRNSYSGAMHGSKSSVAVNYDMMTGDVLTLGSIMHKDATKEDFIALIVNKLEVIAQECYLYDDYQSGVRNRFDTDENLYEDFYFTSTGLCFFFSPYEIAPYASGIITVEIPYYELPGLIYDGYFPSEQQQFQGTMDFAALTDTDLNQFTNMAEIKLNGNTQMILYPEGPVRNIRVRISGDGKDSLDYTVFAAFEMSDEDAVIISADADQFLNITAEYSSHDTSVISPVS